MASFGYVAPDAVVAFRQTALWGVTTTHKDDQPISISAPVRYISGIVKYSNNGQPAAGATVKLYRQSDDFLCQVALTDATGHYLFARSATDIDLYYVVSYTAETAPQVHGTTDRGLVAT